MLNVVYVTTDHRGYCPIREGRLCFTIVFRRKETSQMRRSRTRQLRARKKGRRESSGETRSLIPAEVSFFFIYVYLYYLFFSSFSWRGPVIDIDQATEGTKVEEKHYYLLWFPFNEIQTKKKKEKLSWILRRRQTNSAVTLTSFICIPHSEGGRCN